MSNKINPHETKEASHDVDLGQVYSRTEHFLENNKQAITMGVVGILVVVGGLLGYKKFVAAPKAKEAAELIW